MTRILETDLYPPVKALFEAQGYTVKSEVGAVDVMAMRGDEPPLIVELKTGFTLALVHQGIARQAVTDDVYLAVPRGSGKPWLKTLKGNIGLCRRLGLGLMTVRMRDAFVEVHCEPGPFQPRKVARKKKALVAEFEKRRGDPNTGGATRVGLVTAYRQDAIRCAEYLAVAGPSQGAAVARETGVPRATNIMAADHYGWFEKVSRGVYGLRVGSSIYENIVD